MSGHRHLLRAGIVSGIATMTMNAATYGYIAVAARRLGIDVGGALLALIAAITLVAVPALIFIMALSPLAARWRALGDANRISDLTGRLLFVGGAIGAGTLAASVLARDGIAEFFHLSDPLTIVVAAFTLVAVAAVLAARAFLQALGALKEFSVTNAVEALTKIGAAAVVFVAPPSLRTALLAFMASVTIPAVVSVIYLVSIARPSRRAPPMLRVATRLQYRELMAYGFLTALSLYDAVLARHWLEPIQAGLYNAAALVGRALMTALSFVPTLLGPEIAARSATDRSTTRVFLVTIGITSGICLAVSLFCVLLPEFVIGVIAGKAYVAAARLLATDVVLASSLLLAVLGVSHAAGLGKAPGWSLAVASSVEMVGVALYHPDALGMMRMVCAGHLLVLAVTSIAIVRASLGTARSRDDQSSVRAATAWKG